MPPLLFPSPSRTFLFVHRSLSPSLRRNFCFLLTSNIGKPCINCPSDVQSRHFSLDIRRMSAKSEKGLWAKFEEKKRRKYAETGSMKKQKGSKPTVNIFDGMNLRHLAIALDCDFDALCLRLLDIVSDFKLDSILSDPNAPLDRLLVAQIVSLFDRKPILVAAPKCQHEQQRDLYPQPPPPAEELCPRPPIVTIMGHVDHGKTTLLDALRKSNIVAQEFGGITQHIGAFSVRLPDVCDNRTVTFLDTPGHAAFAAMRERGAHSTDIVVLVVAADDSVMDQTIESIRFAREAGVPMIVAINKCDKPGVDPERVRRDLLQYEILTENFGGDSLSVEISALYGRGIDKLQEAILMQADFLELKSTPRGLAEATVIESSSAQGLGNLCTLIVNRGTLRRGSFLVSGLCWCRVRTISDEFGTSVDSAGPSMPVQISGWRDLLPPPGELALEVQTQQMAERVVAIRTDKKNETESLRAMEAVEGKRSELRQRYETARKEKIAKGQLELSVSYQINDELRKDQKTRAKPPRLSLILKCDVEGTLQAIQTVLDSYSANDQVQLDIVSTGVGPLNESELELAAETKAHIFCFNNNASQRLSMMAKDLKVPLHQFNVIYSLVAHLKALLTERIPAVIERRLVAEGTVLAEYRIPDGLQKKQPVAGLRVDWGKMERDNTIWRFTRQKKMVKEREGNAKSTANLGGQKQSEEAAGAKEPELVTVTLYEGKIQSMQREKLAVASASVEMNIGVTVEDKNIRYKEDDHVEVFEDVRLMQELNWTPPGF